MLYCPSTGVPRVPQDDISSAGPIKAAGNNHMPCLRLDRYPDAKQKMFPKTSGELPSA